MAPLTKRARKLILSENNISFKLFKQKSGVHDINRERSTCGEYHTLFQQLKKYPDRFYEYCRMSENTFNIILAGISDKIKKTCLNYREPISPEERLVVTIRCLATGSSFRALAFSFRMGKTTIAEIVTETCEVIWEELHETYMPYPTTDTWKNIATEYHQNWNFPNCLGSIDGKHIRIKCPVKTGSLYYNYKNFFSINLQAVADAEYKFVVIDVGAYGRESDGGVFRQSLFFELLEKNELNIPPATELPGTKTKVPFVFVGDEAYPLLKNLLRPYPRNQIDIQYKRIFNYRLSRARRMVECSFGIMASKWRILNKSMEMKVDNAIKITKSICLLHNIVLTHDKETISCNLHKDENVKQPCKKANNAFTRNAKDIREIFSAYFTSSLGEIP